MNKAITDGLVLMPPTFEAGLNLWSREDGRPGQGSWAGQPNAAFVPADQDFGGCLELQKTAATTKIRCFQQIPFQPGMYLRVTTRVKCLSGALPELRIAGYAAASNGANVATAVQTGPTVTLPGYGQVVTLSAIIGSGNRGGVGMVWGTAPVYGHLGIDLTGANGGILRIDDITVEDVTEVFLRNMLTWVDVRDFGAKGDGIADDTAAFIAADQAAGQRSVLVSAGTYRLTGNVTFASDVRFEGTVTMPATARLSCTRNFDLNTYTAAFGNEETGFRKAIQALFAFTDHADLDLSGRRIALTAPVDVAATAGITSYQIRRVIRNGQIEAVANAAWTTATATSVATYSTAQPTRLTGVANIANILPGSLVTGTGVGREVYVRSVNVAGGTLELSQPLFAAAGTRTFTFSRFRYLIDLSGFENLGRLELRGLDFDCGGISSALILPRIGLALQIDQCNFNRPKDRAITSSGTGCQGLMVDRCNFLSNEQDQNVQDRTTIALNVNANDSKIRGNRIVRFATFAVLAGTGHMLIGNHFFQGDNTTGGTRRAGVVLTSTNVKTLFTGNYIDNSFIEWSNEHDANPAFSDSFSFGGLTITGNIFTVNDVASHFRWIVVTPRGPGHFLHGLSVTDNVFRTLNGNIDRVEKVDETFATLDGGRTRVLDFSANAFHGVSQITVSPLIIQHDQASVADTWAVEAGPFLPFGCRARNVTSLVTEGAITNASNVTQWVMPHVLTERGPDKTQIQVRWPAAVKGRALLTIRCDNPT